MLKLTVLVLVEVIIGLAVAGVVLAVTVPVLIGRQLLAPGDLTSSLVIGAVLILAVTGMLLRPGSALRRAKR